MGNDDRLAEMRLSRHIPSNNDCFLLFCRVAGGKSINERRGHTLLGFMLRLNNALSAQAFLGFNEKGKTLHVLRRLLGTDRSEYVGMLRGARSPNDETLPQASN